jgi:hypothetical protein
MPLRTFTKKWLGAFRRRPAISGPHKSDRDNLGRRLKRRESWGERFGIAVGIGLVVEYWDDILDCFIHWHAPPMPLLGGLLVTIGVFGEVLFSRLVVLTSEKLQDLADSEVSQANKRAAEALERAAKAEQAAAEANLARAKIEQRMRPRVLDNTEVTSLIDLLVPYQKARVEIIVFDVHVGEPLIFSDQIASIFASAGFASVRHWEAEAGTHRIAGPSVIIAVAKRHEDEFRELADTLACALRALGIDCGVGLGVFGREGPNNQGVIEPYEFRPPQYRLRFEKPKQFMGIRAVAAFRVEVGAKQLTAIPPVRPVTARPQA